jgi:hypothetical protein
MSKWKSVKGKLRSEFHDISPPKLLTSCLGSFQVILIVGLFSEPSSAC